MPARSGEGPFLGHRLFYVSLHGRIGKGALSWVSFIRALIPEPSWRDHFPEAPPLNTITLGVVRFPHVKFGGTQSDRSSQVLIIWLKPIYSISSPHNSLSICIQTSLLSALWICQASPHLRAFAVAVPSTWNIFHLFTTCLAPFHSSWISFNVTSSERISLTILSNLVLSIPQPITFWCITQVMILIIIGNYSVYLITYLFFLPLIDALQEEKNLSFLFTSKSQILWIVPGI